MTDIRLTTNKKNILTEHRQKGGLHETRKFY